MKQQALVVWFLARHRSTPWHIKLLAIFIAAYAFSPIDLIPDFIPVLGLLDDLIIIPLGVYLIIKLSSPELIKAVTKEANEWQADDKNKRPKSRIAAIVIVLIWAILALLFTIWFVKAMY